MTSFSLTRYVFVVTSTKMLLLKHYLVPKTVPTSSPKQPVIHFHIKGVAVTFLLFKMHVDGLFLLTRFNDACNSADDTTFHAYNSDIKTMVNEFEYNYLVSKKLLMNTVSLLFSNNQYVVDIEDSDKAFNDAVIRAFYCCIYVLAEFTIFCRT